MRHRQAQNKPGMIARRGAGFVAWLAQVSPRPLLAWLSSERDASSAAKYNAQADYGPLEIPVPLTAENLGLERGQLSPFDDTVRFKILGIEILRQNLG